jgi:hypothetical protein
MSRRPPPHTTPPDRTRPQAHAPGARAASALVALSLIVGVVAVLGSSTVANAYPRRLDPDGGAYFGARVEARGDESQREALRRVEDQIGRRFAIDHQYYLWGARIPTAHQVWDVETGRIPFINWKAGRDWAEIANGAEDDWIRERADAFIEFAEPIYLTFHHEPENDLSRFGTPGEYAAAFRRIVDVFRARGVTNVAFVWTLMAWSFDPRSDRDPNAYYPGDGYVDFVGADGYNWYPGRPGTEWVSFDEIFTEVNAFSAAHGKPWMAVEYGVQEDPAQPGRKGDWFRAALATARGWPGLKALIYFDVDKDYNWVTDTSSSSMAAYREIANDPYLNPGGGGSDPPPQPSPSPSPDPSPDPPPGGRAPDVVKNGLNEGPDGGSVRAGSSQGRATPFDWVSTTQGATLTFDDMHARGEYSARHVLGSGGDAYYQWNGSRRVWYGRILVWFDALPSGDLRLVRAKAGDALRGSVNIRASGRVGFQDAANDWVVVTRSSIPVGRWVRIEWKFDHRHGRVKIKVFATANAERPSEVVAAGPNLDMGGRVDRVQLGRSGSNAFPVTFWTDSPALSANGFLGPDGVRRR